MFPTSFQSISQRIKSTLLVREGSTQYWHILPYKVNYTASLNVHIILIKGLYGTCFMSLFYGFSCSFFFLYLYFLVQTSQGGAIIKLWCWRKMSQTSCCHNSKSCPIKSKTDIRCDTRLLHIKT